jgi:hypothetical protein
MKFMPTTPKRPDRQSFGFLIKNSHHPGSELSAQSLRVKRAAKTTEIAAKAIPNPGIASALSVEYS